MKYKCMSTREIGERHGFHFERLGDKWRGLCLFHNDQGTPNMFVYPDDSFFCFACKAGGPKSLFVARVLRVSKKLIDKIWTDSDPIEEVMALQLSGKQVNFKPHLQLFLAKFSRAMLGRSKTFDWTELKKYDDFMHGTKAITSEQYAGVVEELTTKYGGIINGKLDDAGAVQSKPTGA